MNRFTHVLAAVMIAGALAAPAAVAAEGGAKPAGARPAGTKPAGAKGLGPAPKLDQLDADKNGQLTVAELERAMMHRPNAPRRAARMFKRMDKNQNGQVDATEFKAWVAKRKRRGIGFGDVMPPKR